MHGLRHPAERAFDFLQHRWVSPRQQRATGLLLVGAFLLSLATIEAKRQGWLPPGLTQSVPDNHFYAVDLALTLLLACEVIGVVFSLVHSVSESLGKQCEIFSLILLRSTFKELTSFQEPVVWEQVRHSIGRMASDALGAAAVFGAIFVFYRLQRHRPITTDADEQASFITTKKAVALVLLAGFLVIAGHDAALWLGGNPTYNFFVAFYTLLIFSDILLVLISLRYSTTYHVVFRNSGFAVATVFMRLGLAAPPFLNAAIGLGAVLFACAVTASYNAFVKLPQPPA